MKVHDITIFAEDSFTPNFDSLDSLGDDIILYLRSDDSTHAPPKLTIFFDNQQEATNFKNAVIQSWEAFLKKTKEKS